MESRYHVRENPRPFDCERKDGGRLGVVSMRFYWVNRVGVLSLLLFP